MGDREVELGEVPNVPNPLGCDFVRYNIICTSRRTTDGPCGALSPWDLGRCNDNVRGLAKKRSMPSGKFLALIFREMAKTSMGSRKFQGIYN